MFNKSKVVCVPPLQVAGSIHFWTLGLIRYNHLPPPRRAQGEKASGGGAGERGRADTRTSLSSNQIGCSTSPLGGSPGAEVGWGGGAKDAAAC